MLVVPPKLVLCGAAQHLRRNEEKLY